MRILKLRMQELLLWLFLVVYDKIMVLPFSNLATGRR